MTVFKLNQNDGVDTLHVEHPFEECNTDQAEGMKAVDEKTAEAFVASGQARLCEHCQPFVEARQVDAP